MPTYLSKPGLYSLLESGFTALTDLQGELGEPQWTVPTCLPGWNVRDAVAHVAATEAMLAGDPAPEADVSHLDHMKNPIAVNNEIWVESLRSLTTDALQEYFRDVTTRRLAALEVMTQEEFDAPSWTPAGPDETYGRFMRIRHYDTFMHEHDIRATLGLPDRSPEPEVASSLDEVATGLGYIVGRRAAMPDGSRVRIELTGPAARTFLVAVDGRAAVVEELDGPPTVDLTLSSMLFLRLTGGRRDGVERADEVVMGGDGDLARRLVENLAFTI